LSGVDLPRGTAEYRFFSTVRKKGKNQKKIIPGKGGVPGGVDVGCVTKEDLCGIGRGEGDN